MRYLLLYEGSILAGLYFLFKNKFEKKTKVVLYLSFGWFIWNLLAISFIKSKPPNFIFQSYLFSLFFAIYIPLLLFSETKFYLSCKSAVERFKKDSPLLAYRALLTVFIVMYGLSIYSYGYLLAQIPKTRAATYKYNSEHEKFYRLGEAIKKNNASTNDIVILNSSQNDCWGRYYVLFLTGSEARTLDEILTYDIPIKVLQQNYNKLYFIVENSNRLPAINVPHSVEVTGDFQA